MLALPPKLSGRKLLAISILATIAACSENQIHAQPMEMTEAISTISVTGTGEVSARPDMAIMNFSVDTQGKDAGAAMQANAQQMTAVINALKQAGIDAKDITTSNLQLNPEYQRDSNGRYSNRIAGYRAINTVTAKLRDLDEVGPTIDAAVNAGANRLDGLSFTFADNSELMDAARRDAVRSARQKAELYADAAGVKLGRVISIQEPGSPMPNYGANLRMARAESMDMATPIEAGEQSISTRINIVYELE